MTLAINYIDQIDELVAEQLGWEKTYDGYFHPDYPDYPRLPRFTTNDYWNRQLLDYLLTEEQCKVTYNLYPDRTEVSVLCYGNYPIIFRLEMKRQHNIALCLAFLRYKGIKFTLGKEIYNDINNN